MVIVLQVDEETKQTGLTEEDLAVDLLTNDEMAAKLLQQQSAESAKQLQHIRKTRVLALIARWRSPPPPPPHTLSSHPLNAHSQNPRKNNLSMLFL